MLLIGAPQKKPGYGSPLDGSRMRPLSKYAGRGDKKCEPATAQDASPDYGNSGNPLDWSCEIITGVDNERRRKERMTKHSGWSTEEFFAMVSHELRTPTSAILGWAELLSIAPVDEETLGRGIETIKRNARLQAELLHQLVEYSRVSTGCLRLDTQRVALAATIEATIETMMPVAKEKSIELRAKLTHSAAFVAGDPYRLQQVFTNLLSNAIKFTPDGGRVEVSFVRRDAYAEATVSDTGRGIEAGALPYIFDRFHQANPIKPSENVGLGLGLAIARELVERHGGSIHASSSGAGKGATFTVHLPLETESMRIDSRVQPSSSDVYEGASD